MTQHRAVQIGTTTSEAPDVHCPRADVYIVGWEDKDPNDPFWRD